MTPPLQVKYNLFQANHSPTTTVLTSCQTFSILENKLSHVRSYTGTQSPPLRGFSSMSLGGAQHLSDRTDLELYNTTVSSKVLPFQHYGAVDPFPHFGPSINYMDFEMSCPDLHPPLYDVPLVDGPTQASTAQPPVSIDNLHSSPPTHNTGQSPQHVSPGSKGRCYDRPGKKPAVDPEPNLIKLHVKICKERGGSNFATEWVFTAFKHEVKKSELRRFLKSHEITAMDFSGGFEPRQVYDGFIIKIGDRYECGLCKEDKRTYWKAKKDAPRHLCKFHFGLADICKACGKNLYCTGEIKSHVCKTIVIATASGNNAV